MEYIRIIPNMTPNYDNNLLKSICLFDSYKTNPNIKCFLASSYVKIILKRGQISIPFVLNTPFDYPQNFDYFELVCTQKYNDQSSIDIFTTLINNYLKSLIVNISLGVILEFISEKSSLISDNLVKLNENDPENDSPDYDTAPEYDTAPDEEKKVTGENDNTPSATIISPVQGSVLKVSKDIVCVESFYNSLITITPQNHYIYMLKMQHISDEGINIPLELVFQELICLLSSYEIIFDDKCPSIYNFLVKDKKHIELVDDSNDPIKEIVEFSFAVTLVPETESFTSEIIPIAPILNKNSLHYLNSGTLTEKLNNYVNNSITNVNIEKYKLNQCYLSEIVKLKMMK